MKHVAIFLITAALVVGSCGFGRIWGQRRADRWWEVHSEQIEVWRHQREDTLREQVKDALEKPAPVCVDAPKPTRKLVSKWECPEGWEISRILKQRLSCVLHMTSPTTAIYYPEGELQTWGPTQEWICANGECHPLVRLYYGNGTWGPPQ